jgi:hypothetical protein
MKLGAQLYSLHKRLNTPEEVREIFESHWQNFESNLSWGYFADYYQDQVNQHKLYGEGEL